MSPVAEAELDHLELLDAARRHLECTFSTRSREEHEDVAGIAYEEFLRKLNRGEEIRKPRALIKRIAEQRMKDQFAEARSAVHKAVAIDPHSATLQGLVDEETDLETALIDRAERARVRASVEGLLSQSERDVYYLRFERELAAKEAAATLGVSRPTYFRVLRSAIDKVQGVVGIPDSFSEVQLKLISAYLAGPEDPDYAAGEELIASDPQSRAVALQQAGLHKGVAALLPPVGIVGDPGLAEGASGGLLRLKERLVGSASDAADATASTVAATGGSRGAGAAAGGGVLAAIGGAGAKVAAVCAGTAAAAACASAVGVLPSAVDPWHLNQSKEEAKAEARSSEDSAPAAPADPTPSPSPDIYTPPPAPDPKPDEGQGGGGGSSADTEPAPPPVEPTPVQQQVDPLAPAPSSTSSSGSGGGGGGGGSGGASAAEKEFGGP